MTQRHEQGDGHGLGEPTDVPRREPLVVPPPRRLSKRAAIVLGLILAAVAAGAIGLAWWLTGVLEKAFSLPPY